MVERSFLVDQTVPRAAADWFREHAESAGLTPDRLGQAELCLDELVTNVVRYAGGSGAHPITLTVSLRRDAEELLVVVEDDGGPFDPRQAPDPVFATTLDEAPTGGRGLFLVRSLADELRYVRENERNRITLAFRVRS